MRNSFDSKFKKGNHDLIAGLALHLKARSWIDPSALQDLLATIANNAGKFSFWRQKCAR